ncbi:MAG: CBS domain-containing protein [Nitrososphaerota archaeon]|nr:CBS domain-containing protein [Nitrososphaerota archaeon]
MVLYAKDIVEPDFIAVGEEISVFEAAKMMKQKKHGFVMLTSNGKPLGIVTEWDLVSKVVAEGKDPAVVQIKEIMSPNIVTVKANDGIDFVSKLMAERGIRRVLVMDKDRIVGVITSKTVLARLEEYINSISTQIARLHSPI